MYYTAVTPHPAAPSAEPPASVERSVQGEGSPWLRPRVLTSRELRELAVEWRARRDPDDAERAEKVARVLEWLATQREPKPAPKTRLQVMGERISAWVGLH